jgi:hypothetical protein
MANKFRVYYYLIPAAPAMNLPGSCKEDIWSIKYKRKKKKRRSFVCFLL